MRRLLLAVTGCLLAMSAAAWGWPYLIWDPISSPSADSFSQVLQRSGYQGIKVQDIGPFLGYLDEYRPICVFSESREVLADSAVLAPVGPALRGYLARGGALYWEGVAAPYFTGYLVDSVLGRYGIATCITEPYDMLTGCSSFFSGMSVGSRTTTSPGIGLAGECAFEAVDLCPTKALAIQQPFRVFLTSYYFADLNDQGPNQRSDYVRAVFNWLAPASVQVKADNATQAVDIDCHPNPCNKATTISLTVGHGMVGALNVYNILGQKMATLFDGFLPAGRHAFVWEAEAFPSGVYFVRLESTTATAVVKVVLLK